MNGRRHAPGRRPLDGSDGEEEDRSGGPRSLSDFHANRELDADRRRRREAGYRRALFLGITVSVLVHAALVAVLSSQLHLPSMETEDRRAPLPDALEGLRLVQVDEPAEIGTPARPAPTEPPSPREEAEEDDAEEADEDARDETAPDDAGDAGEEPEMSNAERLRPREGDPRLWGEFWDEDRRRYVGGSARVDSAVRAILGEYLDSLRLAREAYEDARDWTVGEGDDRWGVSSEGIHLGDVTIPLPVNELFSPAGPRRRELERELRELEAIQRQEQLRDARETREERIEEMRERSTEDAESDSTDSDDDG